MIHGTLEMSAVKSPHRHPPPPRQSTMPNIQSGKELVHWDSQGSLMAHQAWPYGAGTMQQGNITSGVMAPQNVISLIITQVISW
jgi:hypothetical protein